MKKIRIGLNETGKTNLIQWLSRHDKRFNDPSYNVVVAIEQINEKLSQSDRLDYELNSFDSVSGCPEVCCFAEFDFDYEPHPIESIMSSIKHELARMYHNATLQGKLTTASDFESDLFESEFRFQCEVAIDDLDSEEFKTFKRYTGKVYQHGRGGRTVAPEGLINRRGFGWSVKKLDDLDFLNIEDLSELETFYSEIKSFNDRVIEFCKTAPDSFLEYLRDEHKADIKKHQGKTRKVRTVVSYE